jgi:putative heme-binding domain-containing protein
VRLLIYPLYVIIWGTCQLARQDKKYAQSLPALLQDKDAEIKAQAAKWLGDIKYKAAGEKLLPLLKDTNSRVRFFAAEALGRIQYEPAINPIIDMLKNNNDEDAYLRHAGALALSRIGKAEPLIALSGNPSLALRIAAVVALRRMQNAGVAVFLNDANEFVVTEAARAINDDLSIIDALPALANQLNKTPFKNEALIRRCINANLRVGADSSLQNLVMYAQNQAKPAAMRAEAIEALSTWAKPSVLDRVDGRYRGVVHRDSLAVKAKTGDALIQLLKNNDTTVRLSAVKAVNKLGISQSANLLMALLKSDRKADIRAEALKALAAMQSQEIAAAIQQALSDKDKKVRIEGINLVSKLNIPKDLMASLLTDVIKTKTTEEKQAALLSLGNLPVQYSKPTLESLIQQMAGGKLSSEIYLELNEAVDSSHSPELLAMYNKTSTALSPDSLMAAYAGSLSGGDPQRGGDIFYANQNAQCLRCHSFNDYGGNAAPRLNGIASRLTRPQILEALVNPNARIAPGFGTVTLMLKDGKMINGILSAENDKALTIKISEKENQVVQKADVQKRIDGASGMPQIKDLLTKKEIRDVVSFLSTQKEK